MRERIAILVCWLTLVLVVGLSWLFAVWHNPAASPPGPSTSPARSVPVAAPSPPSAAVLDQGARVFRDQGCTSCHALGGAGNPRLPLDGVGGRRQRDELRAWTTGSGIAADKLSPMVVRRKQRYQEMADADMTALLDYLAASRGLPP